MSKLILIISLMNFIAIAAFANPPVKKTTVQIPCKAGVNCLDQVKPQAFKKQQPKKTAAAPKTGEDKIKADCHKQAGDYGDKYQKCLSDHGVFAVERNISSSDNSQSDARLCYVGDPLCDKCLAQSRNAKTRSERRNQVQGCLEADAAAKRAAAKKERTKTTKTKKEETPRKTVVATPSTACTEEAPHRCATKETCEEKHGVWDGRACAIAPCIVGTTPDSRSPILCSCDDEGNHSVQRGTDQICPNACRGGDHKVYDSENRSCVCADGYRDTAGLGGAGVCVADATPAQPSTAAAECLREMQEKVNSCNSAASTAVDQCNPDRKEDDTLGALQTLLQGATGAAMGASQNCAQAAVAGSTGYYALDELRGKCDTEISSCKTSCGDATSYISANKERVYQECRKKQWVYYTGNGFTCRLDNPYPLAFTEDAWNAEWDKDNKAAFDQQVQQMQNNVATNNTKCETGTAVTNREKMSNYMTDMDNTFKSASQCECQLTAGGSNCTNQVGPKDCSADPTLPGCANAQVNCLNPSDNSPRCICFRNPNSDECKSVASNVKQINSNSNLSGFAGPGGSSGFGGVGEVSGGSDKTGVGINPGDLSELKSNEVTAMNASGTTTADASSPFGAANGRGGSPGVNGNFGSGENSVGGDAESSAESRIRGMFNSAKGALGNLFGGSKKNNNETSGYGFGSGGLDANGNPIDAKKWRPGKMIRGLASGSDTEIAGKFEDIWKVMNRQYKVQDQKDSFIFGEKN
ncbi:MAG: hypothetical protein NDI63_10680 [Pseudobdellovibrio sp.]|nr:hypothetical protein [Pseudobdellovibrio sp.]